MKTRMLLCVFTMFVATSACVRAEDIKPATAETVAAYIAAIKKTDHWKLAEGLRTEDAAPRLEAWAKEQSVSLNVVQTNYLAELLGIGEARVDAKSKKPVPMEFPPLPGGAGSGIEVPTPMGRMALALMLDENQQPKGLVLTVSNDDTGANQFTVEPEQVAALAVEHIAAVELLAGSRKPLERFAVRNMSLTEVVEALAHAADLDFVAPRGADTVRITVDLKNVGPREVTAMIGEVAGGWSVTISGGAAQPGVFGTVAESAEPWTAGFADVAKVYANRKLYGLVLPNHPKVETPLDALRQVLSDRMRMQSQGREKIIVTRIVEAPAAPAAPAQPAPAPKDD